MCGNGYVVFFYAGMRIEGSVVGDLALFFVISGDKLPKFC